MVSLGFAVPKRVELGTLPGGRGVPPLSPHQKQRLIAIQTSDIYNPCRSDTQTTAGAGILATAALLGSHTHEARSTVGSCSSNLETTELIAIQENVCQVILQNHFEKLVAGAGDRPSILVMVIHNQAMGFGCVPELSVVVGVASAAILDPIHMVVIVNHFMQQCGGDFLNGSREGSSTNVDFMGSTQLGNPGVFSQGEMTIGFGGGLNGDGGS